jgi:hypothetical protein
LLSLILALCIGLAGCGHEKQPKISGPGDPELRVSPVRAPAKPAQKTATAKPQ